MLSWKCDICAKDTHVHPPVEHVFEEKEVEQPEVYTEDTEVELPAADPHDATKTIKVKKVISVPKTRMKKVIQRTPKMGVMKRQNAQTGIVEDIAIQETKDLQPRAYIVRLHIGQEHVQRDFCLECLNSQILPKLKEVWDQLAAIKGQ